MVGRSFFLDKNEKGNYLRISVIDAVWRVVTVTGIFFKEWSCMECIFPSHFEGVVLQPLSITLLSSAQFLQPMVLLAASWESA